MFKQCPFCPFCPHLFKCTCFLHGPETHKEQIPYQSVPCVKFMQMCQIISTELIQCIGSVLCYPHAARLSGRKAVHQGRIYSIHDALPICHNVVNWLYLHTKWTSLVAQLCLLCRRPGFDPGVGKIPWRSQRLPTPAFWPGEFHGLYSPWGRKESDTAERLSLSLNTKYKVKKKEYPVQRKVGCKMRISYPKGRGRCGSWMQLDVG